MSAPTRDGLVRGTQRLSAAGIETARLDARVLLGLAMNAPSDSIFAEEMASAEQLGRFEALIARRAAREPLAYITGEKEFWSLSFAVGSGVLIPRPETETLIEAALRDFPDGTAPLRVLDIGTGSGCLLIAFLKERPYATGVGIDISKAALAYAARNIVRHSVTDRCRLELETRRDAPSTRNDGAEGGPFSLGAPGDERSQRSTAGEFDVILANPPYLTDAEFAASANEIRDHEPREALAAGQDGLAAIRELGTELSCVLATDGQAYVEVGAGQAQAAAAVLAAAGLDVKRIEHDLLGVSRCVVLGRTGKGGL